MFKRDRRTYGIALVVSACTVLVTLIVLSCKKKSVAAALTMLCAAEGAFGLYLLDEDQCVQKKVTGKVKEKAARVAQKVRIPVGGDEEEEMFENDEEIAAAEETIMDELTADESV